MEQFKGKRIPERFDYTKEDYAPEKQNGQPQWRKDRASKYRLSQIYKEMAINILNDRSLAGTSGNPDWYPRVGEYQQKQSRILRDDMPVYENFGILSVHIGGSPLTADTWQSYEDGETITQYIASLRRSSHRGDVVYTHGRVSEKNYSYPKIIQEVGFQVNFLSSKYMALPELISIYVQQDPDLIRQLTEYLASVRVSNPHDLEEAQITLSDAFYKLSSNTSNN